MQRGVQSRTWRNSTKVTNNSWHLQLGYENRIRTRSLITRRWNGCWRTEIRQRFIDDSVAVTTPKLGFADREVFSIRALLPMHPAAGGGWEPDMFIVDVPKNNIGAFVEKNQPLPSWTARPAL